MPRMRRWIAMAVVVTAIVALPTAAWAKYASSTAANLSVTAATLNPPTNVTLARSCSITGFTARTMAVHWTASQDTDVTGYVVTQTQTSNGNATTTAVTGRASTDATVSAVIGTTYTITVAATRNSWTSTAAAAPSSFTCGLFG